MQVIKLWRSWSIVRHIGHVMIGPNKDINKAVSKGPIVMITAVSWLGRLYTGYSQLWKPYSCRGFSLGVWSVFPLYQQKIIFGAFWLTPEWGIFQIWLPQTQILHWLLRNRRRSESRSLPNRVRSVAVAVLELFSRGHENHYLFRLEWSGTLAVRHHQNQIHVHFPPEVYI